MHMKWHSGTKLMFLYLGEAQLVCTTRSWAWICAAYVNPCFASGPLHTITDPVSEARICSFYLPVPFSEERCRGQKEFAQEQQNWWFWAVSGQNHVLGKCMQTAQNVQKLTTCVNLWCNQGWARGTHDTNKEPYNLSQYPYFCPNSYIFLPTCVYSNSKILKYVQIFQTPVFQYMQSVREFGHC